MILPGRLAGRDDAMLIRRGGSARLAAFVAQLLLRST